LQASVSSANASLESLLERPSKTPATAGCLRQTSRARAGQSWCGLLLQSLTKDLFHVVDKYEPDVLERFFWHFFKVPAVLRRQNDFCHSRATCREDFLFDATYREDVTAQSDFSGH